MKFLRRKALCSAAASLFRRRLSSDTPSSAKVLCMLTRLSRKIPTFVRYQPTNLEICVTPCCEVILQKTPSVAATLARDANINTQQASSSMCYCKLSDCTSFTGPSLNLGADCDMRSLLMISAAQAGCSCVWRRVIGPGGGVQQKENRNM